MRFPTQRQSVRLVLAALAVLTVLGTEQTQAQGTSAVRYPVSRFARSRTDLPVTTLSLGSPTSRTLRGADVHRFAVPLERGQFAAIALDQIDQDLLMVLFDPQGRLLRIVDRNTTHEREVVTLEATVSGRYVVQVAQFDWMVPTAAYSIALTRRAPRARTAVARADQLLGAWYDAAHPGVAVAVLQGSAVIYQRTIGLANVEARTPIDAHTRFDLASVSKQFTGYAIAQLVESGQLRLNQSVREILPELPEIMTPVTVDHLLNHSSGVYDWDVLFGLTGREIADGITPEQVLRMLSRTRALNFAPGSEQSYSNGGYVLLSQVIARVTHEPFDAWMRQHVFAPGGMFETVANADPHAIIPQQAHSYEGRSPRVQLASAQPTSITGSSSVHASLGDLVRWVRALQTGAHATPALMQRLDTPGRLADGKSTGYAYGIWIREQNRVRERSHLGLAAGFRTSIKRFGDNGVTVILLTNDGDDATYSRAEAIERIFRGLPEPSPDETPEDDAVPESAGPHVAFRASDFVGRYESREIETAFDIIARDGELIAQHAVIGEVPLVATGGDVFRSAKPLLPLIAFAHYTSGRVTGFEVRSAGARHLAFARVER